MLSQLMKTNAKRVLYSINVEDVQRVARETLDRELSDAEIEKVSEHLGNQIGWYEAVASCFDEVLEGAVTAS